MYKRYLLFILITVLNVSCFKHIGSEDPEETKEAFYPNKLTILYVENEQSNISISYPDTNTSIETINITDSLFFETAQNIGVWLFNPQDEKIDLINVQIIFENNNIWERSNSGPNLFVNLKDGWQLYRWPVSDGNTQGFGILPHRIKITIQGNNVKNIAIKYVFAETPDKAKLLFIQDGGYLKGWTEAGLVEGQEVSGIENCDIHNIPITWALNPKKIIEKDSTTIPLEYLRKMQKNSINHWSFHSFNRQILANASVEELEQDYKNSIEWLKNNGFGKIHFRAAYTQNNAPAAEFITEYIKNMDIHAAGTYTQTTGGFETFPFTNRWNLNRWAIHGSTKSEMDKKFEILKQRHCLILAYTHRIIANNENSPFDITLENWEYFLNKVSEGVNEGWLEAISYNDLEAALKKYEILDDDYSIALAIRRELQNKTNKP